MAIAANILLGTCGGQWGVGSLCITTDLVSINTVPICKHLGNWNVRDVGELVAFSRNWEVNSCLLHSCNRELVLVMTRLYYSSSN